MLALTILTLSIFVINAVVAYTAGNSALTLNYNLITEDIAGRHYTPQCLGTCDLVFSLSYTGTLAPSSVVIDSNKLQMQFNWVKGQDKFKESRIYYLNEYQEQVTDYSTICNSYNNTEGFDGNWTYSTFQNCTQVASGSHFVNKQEWKEIDSLTLEKGKTYYIDIRGYFKPMLGEGFDVDVIPSINIAGQDFSMTEMAWWNSSWLKAKNITMTNPEASSHSTEYVEVNLTGVTISTNNCSKEIVIIDNSSNQIGADVLDSDTSGAAGTDWCYVSFLANLSASETLNYTAYYDNQNADEQEELITITSNTSGNTWRWEFEEYGNATNLNGWFNISTGGTATTDNWLVSDFGKRNGTRGAYDYVTGATHGVLARNFSAISNPAFLCIEYYDAADPGQPGFGISANNRWGFAGNDLIDDWITFYGGGALIKYGGNETTTGKNAVINDWNDVCISYYDSGYMDILVNGTKIYNRATLSGTPSQTFDKFFFFMNNDKPRIDDLVIGKGKYYGNNTATYSLGAEMSSGGGGGQSATESQGDSAILSGIGNSTINSSYTAYPSQQLYMRNVTGSQVKGRFDYVASSGNQRWAFNYVTTNDPTSDFTYMVNITPTLYVLEMSNLTFSQIKEQVTALINGTKQT